MNWEQITLDTFIPEYPKIFNNTIASVQRYFDVFYDGSSGVLVKPLTTTGRVKGARGEFVTAVVDNLVVKNQFTNLYDNNTTADYNWYKMYTDPAPIPRDPCTASNYWPYENYSGFKVIDVNKPYYKITNANPILLGNINLSQVVGIFFDSSLVTSNDFEILLDPCLGTTYVVDASDAGRAYVELVATGYDPSWGTTWSQYKYAADDSSTGSGGYGSVGPGTIGVIPVFDGIYKVGDSSVYMIGDELIARDIQINNALRDSSNNILVGYGSPMQLNDPASGRDVSIYGNVNFDGSLVSVIAGIFNVDGSIILNGEEVGLGKYDPPLADDLKMPYAVGGIPADTSVAYLRNKTFEQLFTEMFFPTVLAYVGTAKSISLGGIATTTDEVGTTYAPSVSTTFNQGQIKNGDNSNGPALVGGISLYYYRKPDGTLDATIGSTSWSFSSYQIAFGSNIWTVSGTHAAGTGTYYDNKGNAVTNLDAQRVSALVSANSGTVTGRRYAWRGYGAQYSAPTDSTGVRALSSKSFLSGTNTGTFDVVIPAGTQEVYFFLPAGKTVVVQYVESSFADVTGSFVQSAITVNDAAGTGQSYTSYVSYIGASGYPSTATYRITVS